MMTLSTRERDRSRFYPVRDVKKSETVEALERQEARIHVRQMGELLRQQDEDEAERLRKRIRDLGERPCA